MGKVSQIWDPLLQLHPKKLISNKLIKVFKNFKWENNLRWLKMSLKITLKTHFKIYIKNIDLFAAFIFKLIFKMYLKL